MNGRIIIKIPDCPSFCPNCKSLMFPYLGKMLCRLCGYAWTKQDIKEREIEQEQEKIAKKIFENGNELYKIGKYNDAIENYKKALEISPNLEDKINPKLTKALNSIKTLKDCTEKEGREILNKLRRGIAPEEFIQELTVGRDKEIEKIKNKLNNVSKGNFEYDFVQEFYGNGKTHFANLIRAIALNDGFAVSKVNIEQNSNFNKILNIYRNIVMNIEVKDNKGLNDIIEENYKQIKDWTWNKNFSEEHIFHYGLRVLTSDKAYQNEKEMIIRWIEGEEINLSDVRWAIKRNYVIPREHCTRWTPYGLQIPIQPCKISSENVFILLSDLIELLKEIGYKGLVIIIDEGENINKRSIITNKRSRENAYTNLRRFIEEEISSLYFITTITREFFEELRYDGERYNIVETKFWNKIKPISLNTLNSEDYKKLTKKICFICEKAYNVSLKDIENNFNEIDKFAENSDNIREFLQKCVDYIETTAQRLEA